MPPRISDVRRLISDLRPLTSGLLHFRRRLLKERLERVCRRYLVARLFQTQPVSSYGRRQAVLIIVSPAVPGATFCQFSSCSLFVSKTLPVLSYSITVLTRS